MHPVPLGAIDAWLAEARHAGSGLIRKFLPGSTCCGPIRGSKTGKGRRRPRLKELRV